MTEWTPTQTCAMQLHGRDILVSAAAGSGKTATLTERIIRSLLAVDDTGKHTGDISRMLVVTFTRAAAAELRSRISSALSDAIAEHPDDRYLYQQLLALGNARICTIDSFYLEPVRANFERLGLPSSFRLADQAELAPLKEQLLRRLIDERYAAAANQDTAALDTPLDRLEGNAFALAMDDLLPNRDRGDTEKVLLALFKKLIAYPEGIELLRMSADRLQAQAELPFAQSAEGQILVSQLKEELSYYQTVLQQACTLLKTDANLAAGYMPSFAHDLDTVTQLLADLDADDWYGADKRVKEYAPISLRAPKRGAELTLDPEPLKEQRTAITKAIRAMATTVFCHTPEEEREQMLRTARTQRMLYSLLRDYDVAIDELKKNRGVLDFSDVRRYLLKLLIDKDGNPTETARALADEFDAVYIDEYQDIDTVQDLIFATLGHGGKRFMVGDIKQSIYSFRGAEPSIFAAYRRAFPQVKSVDDALCPTGNSIFMSNNFRCDESVIRFANAVCGYTFGVCEKSLGYKAEDDLIFSKRPPHSQSTVEVVLIEKTTKKKKDESTAPADEASTTADESGGEPVAPEAIYVAGEIARLLREKKRADGTPLRASDVAILLRSMTSAGDYSKALRAFGIRCTNAAAEELAHHPDMTLLLNLLSVIDNPRDDIPLMGLFSRPESPISITDMMALRNISTKTHSLFDDICTALQEQDAERRAALAWSERTYDAIRTFVTHLERWRGWAATLPIDRLLRQLYNEPFLADRATTPVFLTLYEHARTYQNASFCGLYQFLSYFRRLLDKPDQLAAAGFGGTEDAVRIMTIHKSKGLEFPVVFLCNAAQPFNTRDSISPILFSPELGAATAHYDADRCALLPTVTRRAISAQLAEQQSEEEMRILYVALTRARERLYVTATLSLTTAQKKLQRANRQTRGQRFPVLSVNNHLDWVLGALAPANRLTDNDFMRYTVLDSSALCLPADPVVPQPSSAPTSVPSSPDAAFYRNILEEHRRFSDPNTLIRRLPTKAAASKLRLAMLDGAWLAEDFDVDTAFTAPFDATDLTFSDTEEAVRRHIQLLQRAAPPFEELLTVNEQATAAERGTATHLFLQHCDFARLATTSLSDEIERLLQARLLSRRSADILRRDQLEKFIQSELFAQLSQKDIKLWRELHFDRFLPYSRLTRNQALAQQLQDYTLYVQGSLDLLVKTADGTLWLYDYKTDYIPDTAEDAVRAKLLHDHADQLRVYAEAVEGLFGRRPDHVCIYALSLGRSVELTDDL